MGQRKVLVVDDDPNVLELISLYLVKEGFAVVTAEDGRAAVGKHGSERPDLVILDIMLPEVDGWDVCKEIRRHSKTPIIVLSAKDEDYDRILGLELGADDYVTKPFNPRELVARVKAVLRRFEDGQLHTRELVIEYPHLYINRADYVVKDSRGKVPLTAKEVDILWLLASHPGKVFTREQILNRVWGYDFAGDSRTVDTHIKRIRQKLGRSPDRGWEIETVWGVGYRFEVSDE